ncbi:L-rhamnose-binding lectin SML-like [Larimichthys crocea]|uniref:L-rhamnose-binding lectin SML-like n=1 Tax=Larimichthys crocea TaxID=215358 RepID=UPI000900D053|nr:L-rhamnose-binding lectin SML-like [Larimichthys crocea]
MLCFSITLLLSATCLLVNAVAETVTTCEGDNVHRLSCDIGVISVETVLYGLADSGMCSEGKPLQEVSESCSPLRTVDNLKTRCNGKRVCEVTESVFGASQSCSGTFKYVQTNYTCLPAIHLVTCEHSVAHLQCDVGQIIHVYGADYGRRDQTTCSYKRPPSQIQNTDCSNPTNIVSDSCNGENSCTVKASNSVFGESCVGTLKYLEVAYVCEYPDPKAEESTRIK